MKIAIVHTSADSTRGGAETSIVEMAAALAALGEDVTIVTRGGPLNDSQSRADAHRQLPNSVTLPGSGFTKAAQIRSFLAEAAQYCREQGFDIVHAVVPLRGCHVYQPRGGTYAATQAANVEIQKSGLAKGAKRLFQQLNRKQSLLHRLELEMLRSNPPHVAAVSRLGERQITALVPDFPRDRLHTVFNACDVGRIAPRTAESCAAARAALAIKPDRPVLLFVAHNFKLKGLRELLNALAPPRFELNRPLLLVAGRDRAAPFQALATALGLGESVRFLGSSSRVSDLYAAANALVHPTWYDPCSRVVLEALCHGLPVVTTLQNGAAEGLGADSGFVVDSPADLSGLADAMRQALSEKARQAALQNAARARQQLSMERHARELIGLYALILRS